MQRRIAVLDYLTTDQTIEEYRRTSAEKDHSVRAGLAENGVAPYDGHHPGGMPRFIAAPAGGLLCS
jgi:hypothetical protein